MDPHNKQHWLAQSSRAGHNRLDGKALRVRTKKALCFLVFFLGSLWRQDNRQAKITGLVADRYRRA